MNYFFEICKKCLAFCFCYSVDMVAMVDSYSAKLSAYDSRVVQYSVQQRMTELACMIEKFGREYVDCSKFLENSLLIRVYNSNLETMLESLKTSRSLTCCLLALRLTPVDLDKVSSQIKRNLITCLARNYKIELLSRCNLKKKIIMDISSFEKLFYEGEKHIFHEEDVSILLGVSLPEKRFYFFQQPSMEDHFLYSRCILGVLRTKAIEEYNANSKKELLLKYLQPDSNREIFQFSQIVTNPALVDIITLIINYNKVFFGLNKVNWSNMPSDVHQGFSVIRQQVESCMKFSKGIVLPANQAFAIMEYIAPEGIYHIFDEAECYLVNLIYPDGELLEEDKWCEYIAGSYRSRFLRQNMKDCLDSFIDAVNKKMD